MKQLEENNCKSDNYLNIVDKLFRKDINAQNKCLIMVFKQLKIENGTFSIFLGQIPLTFLNDTP